MLERDLLEKMLLDKPLTKAEEAELDRMLEGDGVRSLVSAMVQDEPSLTWRSQLNERVVALSSAAQKKTRWLHIWKPAFALGAAGALACVMFLSSNAADPHNSAEIEAGLVAVHRETLHATQIAGSGLTQFEATPTVFSGAMVSHPDWDEVDIEPL